MAISIKEYLGFEGLHVDWNYDKKSRNLQESVVSNDYIDPASLMVDIEGIHVGGTRNFTWYTESALKSSVPTWTKPYLRPLIMHHNEKDGKIIGRIKFATYTDKNTRSGTGALLFTCNVPDKDGKEQIKDGRLKTVSIGVIVHSATCSICGHDIAVHGPCEHERGQNYDDQTCYWMIHSMEAKELSYVIVPSDIYAHNVRVYSPEAKDLKEFIQEGVLNMSEQTIVTDPVGLDQTETKIIDEDVKLKTEDPLVDDSENKELEELRTKHAALLKENDELKTENQKLKGDAEKASTDLGTATTLLDQAKKEVKTAQDSLILKEAEIVKERQLRESIEDEVISFQKRSKDSLVEQIVLLRESLGKPEIDTLSLAERSDDSLKDAIKDLKEEFKNPMDVTKIEKPDNAGLVENLEINKTTVKEDKNTSNIDLAEGFENILNGLFGSHKNY